MSDKLIQIHADAIQRFDSIQSAVRNERLQCLDDRRFCSISGAQWEGSLGDQFENKPRFEVNKIHLAVIRIINEYRNNRIGVEFTSKEGDEYDKLADTCAGLFRADEQDSGAEEAYDNAFEEAVTGGIGAFRLRAVYEDEEDEDDERQRIRIEPIMDADSTVFFDLQAKRQDKADAQYCFVLSSMTPEAYEEQWGDDPTTWQKTILRTQFDWMTPDVVYVAEYYTVEEKSEVVRTVKSLDGEEEKVGEAEWEQEGEVMLATGYTVVRQKLED